MITILGASGFIGSAVAVRAREIGLAVSAYGRSDPLPQELGQVIYCAGLTADFRTRPLDAVDAHVSHLVDVIRNHEFKRLAYLSSTRVYGAGAGPAEEEAALALRPLDPSDLYDLSKAMGESVTATLGARGVSVRLSNVYGPAMPPSNFLADVLRQAASGSVELRTALASAKDYISVLDVADLLLKIVQHGSAPLYNLASGVNVTNGEILDRLKSVLGCAVRVVPGAPKIAFPRIATRRIQSEFAFTPRALLAEIPSLSKHYAPKPEPP